MKQRIIGFDLARAYAILGMFIVNFNTAFGSRTDNSLPAQFLSLFNGNSSTLFVILAGMGIALSTSTEMNTPVEKQKLRTTVLKRAAFLFITGIALNVIWPADILHFYGCYMFLTAFVLFADKKYFLILATLSVLIFHLLIFIIPYQTGWDFQTMQYADFYTVKGFLRNTFYNGWNPVFPWISYFLLGMYLGKLNWTNLDVQRKMFIIGLILYLPVAALQLLFKHIPVPENVKFFMLADYLPPFLPFIISTSGFSIMLLAGFMYLGNKVKDNKFAADIASTGQMTLTHYISHLTIGMVLFSIFGIKGLPEEESLQPSSPLLILNFSIAYFALSFCLSILWATYYKHGPLETILRKISG